LAWSWLQDRFDDQFQPVTDELGQSIRSGNLVCGGTRFLECRFFVITDGMSPGRKTALRVVVVPQAAGALFRGHDLLGRD
jgi:hypothetical protein